VTDLLQDLHGRATPVSTDSLFGTPRQYKDPDMKLIVRLTQPSLERLEYADVKPPAVIVPLTDEFQTRLREAREAILRSGFASASFSFGFDIPDEFPKDDPTRARFFDAVNALLYQHDKIVALEDDMPELGAMVEEGPMRGPTIQVTKDGWKAQFHNRYTDETFESMLVTDFHEPIPAHEVEAEWAALIERPSRRHVADASPSL
jgi:hypothetical protein